MFTYTPGIKVWPVVSEQKDGCPSLTVEFLDDGEDVFYVRFDVCQASWCPIDDTCCPRSAESIKFIMKTKKEREKNKISPALSQFFTRFCLKWCHIDQDNKPLQIRHDKLVWKHHPFIAHLYLVM